MLLPVRNEGLLPAEYKDHPLTGESDDLRECYVGGDFLLI
ncbi:type II toxin-antitoxin system YafQ family toxin [Paraburkholderia sp. MM6662-R1]